MIQHKITALCLLKLPAAFDTIDHSILVHRLSPWFGLNGTVLSRLQSYLSSRNFVVNLNGFHHLPSPFLKVFLKVSFCVLILHATPLSSHTSDSSVKHHLYADDTQLFISFSAPDFSQNISHFETTIDTVSTNYLDFS